MKSSKLARFCTLAIVVCFLTPSQRAWAADHSAANKVSPPSNQTTTTSTGRPTPAQAGKRDSLAEVIEQYDSEKKNEYVTKSQAPTKDLPWNFYTQSWTIKVNGEKAVVFLQSPPDSMRQVDLMVVTSKGAFAFRTPDMGGRSTTFDFTIPGVGQSTLRMEPSGVKNKEGNPNCYLRQVSGTASVHAKLAVSYYARNNSTGIDSLQYAIRAMKTQPMPVPQAESEAFAPPPAGYDPGYTAADFFNMN